MTSPNLLAPYLKVTVGAIGSLQSETFMIGDGKLVSATVQLGEGTLQSNCSFTVRDPDKRLLDKFLAYIESVDGLDQLTEPAPRISDISTTVNTNPESHVGKPELETQPGQVIYANAQASTYGYGESTQGGQIGAYGDRIQWNGLFAAMVDTKYKYASMRVTNLTTGKSIVVKVVDRGPFAVVNGRAARPLREHPTRKIDLTPGAWSALTNGAAPGIINVKIEWIQPGTIAASPNQPSKEQVDAAIATEQKKESTQSQPTIPVPEKAPANPSTRTLVGSQITIEAGYDGQTIAAWSFIHNGLRYSLFDPDLLEFSGQAATWVMTRRLKNTVYQKMTFKKLATKIAAAYGITVVMSEEGPYYEYFPQRGQNDYELLLAEARRIGYRVHTKGAKLYIEPREKSSVVNPDTFVLEYGVNMGLSFDITHQAESDTKGGARSSDPGNRTTTGIVKFEIDPDTGKVKQTKKESDAGLGNDTTAIISGNALPTPKPRTDGTTANVDSQRRENEKRIKGIKANASFPTTPEALLITPDTALQTKGISVTADRYWVVDSVELQYKEGGFTTNLNLYSPLRNKYPSSDINTPTQSTSPPPPQSPATPFDANAPKFVRPTTGPITSLHRTENPKRPNHRGIDYGASAGTPVVAAASGTVSNVVTGCKVGDGACGGGYGNIVYLNHGNGWETRYAHLTTVTVANGATINQGQQVGTVGNTGRSRGAHLHFETRKDGNDLNPRKYIPE
ncbi:peptidoglycan DD-metalloendopeptidase family protein [Nostoc piscinale]|uniref:peptidoglycan DD-metalloendopeptidase family protein n=1 Tax=Nostoc piscinale TaxID=224012 RepID=UPI000780EC94|nr:peptidoglycan DD-metalloendopeptidase family protein [Nostoc piscinale]